jgi:hypothetical protein
MKTPMQELKEELWRKPKEVSKKDVLILIDKMMSLEREHLIDAANYGRNRYINEQLENKYKGSDRTFGDNYYIDLYKNT